MIRQIAIMTLQVAGDYYDADDERFIRVIGKNNEWMSQFFDVAHLHKDYDIRVQNSSALPQSKAARTQTLLDLQERFPDQISGAQVLDMLDMAQSEKFIDSATVSVRAAEAENEQMMNVDMNQEITVMVNPEEYEDHIAHWRIHSRQVMEYAFKHMTPPNIQERFKDHILATEMLMIDKAKINPLFAQELQTLKNFPLFFRAAPSVDARAAEEASEASAVGEAAGQGQPVTPIAGPLSMESQLPVNPEVGSPEAQLAVAEATAPIGSQIGGETGPIQPTGAI